MSVIFFRALEKELARLRMMRDTASERGIKARIEEIDGLLKVERSPFIQEVLGKERRKLQSLEAKASLQEYVEPVLELLEKAHGQLTSVPDYTQGRRRGRPRKRGN